MKKNKPPKIIKHKARHHLKHDSCELPYRTTYCDDEHHIEVIVGHWNKVTCPLCLEEKNNYKNKKQTLPKTNEMKLKHLERRQQFKNDWNKRPPQKEERTQTFTNNITYIRTSY